MTRLQQEMQRMADDNAQIERLEDAGAKKDAEIARLREQLSGANAMIDALREAERIERIKNTRLRAALKPFEEFTRAQEQVRTRGIPLSFHDLAAGACVAVVPSHDDYRAALKALEET